MDLVDRVLATIRRHAMFAGGDTVLVAVSGGADSLALLHVLGCLVPSFGLTLHVAHVDHRLRPDSSDDAAFVRRHAASLGLGCDVVTVDVPRTGSLEDAARRARYAALGAIADRIGADRIAIGHTADDQAETVVMRVIQGAGPRGLAGIPPVRGRIVRPLIDTPRAVLRELLRRRGIAWRDDPSNADPRFVRNRLRRDVMPRLAREHAGIVDALGRTARLMRQMIGVAERIAASELAQGIAGPDGVTLSRDRLRGLPEAVAAEVVRQASVSLGGDAALRAAAYRAVARALADPPPRRALRAGRVTIEVSGVRLRIARAPRPAVVPRRLTVPGVTALPEVALALNARLLDREGYAVPTSATCVAFDADQVSAPLVVRARRHGDRFAPFRGAERKLKDVLISEKVPRWDRDALPIVESGGTIVWVAGVRRGNAAPVTARTRCVLEMAVMAVGPLAQRPADR